MASAGDAEAAMQLFSAKLSEVEANLAAVTALLDQQTKADARSPAPPVPRD